MMTPEQKKVVSKAYDHLLKSEKRGWDSLDDYIDCLEYLEDGQLLREADVIYSTHKNVKVKCGEEHGKEKCFIPLLVESIGYILDLYLDSEDLHVKDKYILQYYLAINEAGMILIES